MADSKVITRNDVQNILAHINLGDDAHREITQAEFNALSQAEKNNGTIYFITDGVSGNVFLEDNVPIGTITPYGGDSDPDYWLICDGRAISRTTYADLFAVIGTTYGTGDGSTTFNIPDLRGNVAVGASTVYNLGDSGGEATHTLQTSEIPAHTHGSKSLTGGFAAYRWDNGSSSGIFTVTGNTKNMTMSSGDKIAHTSYSVNATHQHDSVGGSGAHNNMQPYIVTNYIIKYTSTVSEHQATVDFFYPVGSYYETSDTSFNPNTTWGGTWVLETEGLVHISAGPNYTVAGALTDTTDGGEATHKLTTTEIPSHTHGQKTLTGTLRPLYWTTQQGKTEGICTIASGNKDRTASSGTNLGTATTTINASHEHSSVGGNGTHNNMQPYIIVNRWHRTA